VVTKGFDLAQYGQALGSWKACWHNLVVVSLILMVTPPVIGAASPGANPEAVREVQAGKRKVAEAVWWGFNPEDSTSALQAAIKSGAEKVMVAKMDTPWITDKLELASNQELFFEPGTVVLAKQGAFQAKGDCLFTANACRNLRLVGYGATLQMRRSEYDSKAYSKSEWRHLLSLRGCTNVVVAGLTLLESGGDGIYVAVSKNGAPCSDVEIKDVTCDRNYRQGVSVISAVNLSLLKCIFKNTAGTAPAAGIDFEPNHASEKLVNCLMRDCVIENNQGHAITLYVGHYDKTSAPISLRVENCVTRGTNRNSVGVNIRCVEDEVPPGGAIDFVNCRFEDRGRAQISIAKPAASARVRFENCVLADAATNPSTNAPVVIASRAGDSCPLGGVLFQNLILQEKIVRPFLDFHDAAGVAFSNVTGTIIIERAGVRETKEIDQRYLEAAMPLNPMFQIPGYKAGSGKLTLARINTEPQAVKVGAHRLRDKAEYLIYAEQGQTVRFKLALKAVGRSTPTPLPVKVLAPSGKAAGKYTAQPQVETECTFVAAETGFHRVLAIPNSHTMTLSNASHPVCMTNPRGFFHFIHTAGDFYFSVPEGTKAFGIKLAGGGVGETFRVALSDPAGKEVWSRDNISQVEGFMAGQPSECRPGVWKIHMDKASTAVFEDHFVELRGLPPYLASHPDALPVIIP
jgi:hypothetical protein